MTTLKTTRNDKDVHSFLEGVAATNEQRSRDALELLAIFEHATGMKPSMWGDSIVGFGSYHYKSERSTQEGDWPLTGFSPRKANMTVYIMPGFEKFGDELSKLGKHRTSVSCIYFNKLADIDRDVLEKMITKSVIEMKRQYPS